MSIREAAQHIVPGTVIAGDFNGDGVIDLAAASASSTVAPPVMVVLGTGDGTFKAAMASGVAGGLRAAGEFNKDGKLDLIVAGGATSALTLWPGKGNGTFGPARPIGAESTFDVGDAVVDDVNGDGNLDVVVVLGDARTSTGCMSILATAMGRSERQRYNCLPAPMPARSSHVDGPAILQRQVVPSLVQ